MGPDELGLNASLTTLGPYVARMMFSLGICGRTIFFLPQYEIEMRQLQRISAMAIVMLTGSNTPASGECNELGIAAYSAVQDLDIVTVFANGVHRTGGFRNCLTLGPEDVFPPIYEFKIKRPQGGTIQVITPFTVLATFESDDPIEHVTVRDARGTHKVAVVQIVSPKDKGLCKVVSKAAVGEPGMNSRLHHEVDGDREVVMVIRNVDSSLCGNTGVVAMLVVNGKPISHGDITRSKSSIQASARPGDHMFAIVHTVDLFNNIKCVRLGELKFTLEQCDLE